MNSRITWSAIDNPSRRKELQKLAAKLKRKGFGRIQLNSHGAGKFSIDGFADNSDEEDGALTAPDQQRADRAIALAESIGAGCTPRQVATAKRNASKLAK